MCSMHSDLPLNPGVTAREVTAGIIKPLKFSVASIVRKSVGCRPTETIEAPGTPHES
jgi:hypothetical protein